MSLSAGTTTPDTRRSGRQMPWEGLGGGWRPAGPFPWETGLGWWREPDKVGGGGEEMVGSARNRHCIFLPILGILEGNSPQLILVTVT